MTSVDFEVQRAALGTSRYVTHPTPSDLGAGEVLMALDTFGFSANNITYAVIGDMMNYWDFFPASDKGEKTWGRVPVWGFADVAVSNCEGVEVGQRFYGYFPMSTHLILRPKKISPDGFFDGSDHRSKLAAAYNRYSNVAKDPAYDAAHEPEHMLLQPLFMTSFLIDDFLEQEKFFGTKTIILSSASSKTAMALAFILSRRKDVNVVGLTSAGNKAFVEGLGFYDTVTLYDDVSSLPADEAVVYVDMSGDGPLRASLHNHFADNMRYSCMVGATHKDKLGLATGLPGAKPILFIAPGYAAERSKELGPQELQSRAASVWKAFVVTAKDWMVVKKTSGQDAVGALFAEMLDGKVNPRDGHVLTLKD